jgi:hypothetical protein
MDFAACLHVNLMVTRRMNNRSPIRILDVKLECGGRSVCRRPLEAGACDRVDGGAQEWRGLPWFAYVRENRAVVFAFALMADKCAS